MNPGLQWLYIAILCFHTYFCPSVSSPSLVSCHIKSLHSSNSSPKTIRITQLYHAPRSFCDCRARSRMYCTGLRATQALPGWPVQLWCWPAQQGTWSWWWLSQPCSPSLGWVQKTRPCLIKATTSRKCIKNFCITLPLQQIWLKVASGL